MVYPEIIEGMYVRLRAAEESDAEVTLKMRLNKEKTKFLHPYLSQIPSLVQNRHF